MEDEDEWSPDERFRFRASKAEGKGKSNVKTHRTIQRTDKLIWWSELVLFNIQLYCQCKSMLNTRWRKRMLGYLRKNSFLCINLFKTNNNYSSNDNQSFAMTLHQRSASCRV